MPSTARPWVHIPLWEGRRKLGEWQRVLLVSTVLQYDVIMGRVNVAEPRALGRGVVRIVPWDHGSFLVR